MLTYKGYRYSKQYFIEMSLSSTENFGHRTNQNRSLLALDKNYCHEDEYRRNGQPSGLISSIIHEMQENADGTLSCISIFANDDSFAEGMINNGKNLLICYDQSLDEQKYNEPKFLFFVISRSVGRVLWDETSDGDEK